MSSPPLVSIVMTSYQHAAFIEEAIESALAQTYPNFELVIADDGSTDGTWEIIQSYARRHPDRVVALPQRENRGAEGMMDNSRRVFRAARGKYITILEADDVYLPEKLERQVAWMEADERRVLCTHETEVFYSGSDETALYTELHHPLCSGSGPERLVSNYPFATVSVMLRASAMPEHINHPRLKIAGDWFLAFECLANGGAFGFVEGTLARHRRHSANLTSRMRDVHMADFLTTIELMEERRPDLAPLCRDSRASMLYGWGVQCLRGGDVATARGFLRRSIGQRLRLKPLAAMLTAHLPGPLATGLARWKERR